MRFEKAGLQHQPTLFRWLIEPHVQEFWDNSEAHQNDILNFMHGRKEPSSYADGLYVYWVGFIDKNPYSLLMTIREDPGQERPQIKNDHLSKTGTTYSLDYMIGNKDYWGKGLGAQTLTEFITFFQQEVDPQADMFFIDPDINNPRAKHVYQKAGFKHVGNFIMEGNGVFAGRETCFLVKSQI